MIPSSFSLPIPSLYILAGIFSCPAQNPANIQLNFLVEAPRIDNTKGDHFLKNLQTSSSSPHYNGRFPVINGITDSKVRVESDIRFSSATMPLIKKSCLQIKEINIRINYDSTIYIARNIPYGSCKYNITHEHENKHVDVYLNTINEYIPYVKDMAADIAASWMSTDYINQQDLDSKQTNISKDLQSNLENAMDSMTQAISLRQKNVDTIEEYKRLSTFCGEK